MPFPRIEVRECCNCDEVVCLGCDVDEAAGDAASKRKYGYCYKCGHKVWMPVPKRLAEDYHVTISKTVCSHCRR